MDQHNDPSLQDAGRIAVAQLEPETWLQVNRLLVRKAIAEFAHELLLEPIATGADGIWQTYVLADEAQRLEYRFHARKMSLDHWHIDPDSIEKSIDGKAAPLDALKFVIEFQEPLGIREAMMAVYLDEISSILYGAAYKRAFKPHHAARLALGEYQQIETGMTEGHPTFVANNGRIGFDTLDYPIYAPEAAHAQSIIWVAVVRRNATFTAMQGLDYNRLMREELGAETIAGFKSILEAKGLDPDAYYFMPVHPWQWFNRISMSFAAEIALNNVVYLGLSPDLYLPQQSIRTFFNISHPTRRYVKMALSILNMGFMLMRGLSPEDMAATPPVNDWVRGLVNADPYLQDNGFQIICEAATLGYRNSYYEQGLKSDSGYKHMLSALWRESPVALLGKNERLMTMAALLHLDPQGESLTAALIEASGLDADTWIERYLKAYLSPILHCLYAYDIIYMPHGENVILMLEDNAPARIVMKDIAEEMRILNDGAGLPPAVRRNCVIVRDEVWLDGIFTDVFDCYFRHLAAILDDKGVLPEQRFWSLVAKCVEDYQASQPQLAEKFARHDLFIAEFPRNCINRLQLRDNQQLLDPNDPAKGFQYAGTLRNPLAAAKGKAMAASQAKPDQTRPEVATVEAERG